MPATVTSFHDHRSAGARGRVDSERCPAGLAWEREGVTTATPPRLAQLKAFMKPSPFPPVERRGPPRERRDDLVLMDVRRRLQPSPTVMPSEGAGRRLRRRGERPGRL